MFNTKPRCTLIIGHAINKIISQYAQGNTAQLRENVSYRKNEDSEGSSYTLIQGQVVGSDSDQYVKSSY